MGTPVIRGATMRLLGAVLAAVVLVVAAPPAHAKDAGARIRKRLVVGKKLFDALEYRKAIRALRPVTTASVATRAQRLRAHELIGLSYLILGNKKRARAAFEDLLTIDPGYQLSDDTGSPKIRRFFDRVKRAFVPNASTDRIELSHAAPKSAMGAHRVEIELLVGRGAGQVKEVNLWYRRRGLLRYRRQRMVPYGRRDGRERWRARFSAPATDQPSALDYYIEAKDIGGRVVGRIAGPVSPLSIALSPGRVRKSPWYRRWYVIAGGAAALGITGALLFSASSDVAPGTLEPGKVVLTP